MGAGWRSLPSVACGPAEAAGAAPGASCAILGAMVEIAGDSTRDGCWALVRLRLDGDRIVDADADGLAEDIRGLTLLEAAAVGGETLAVDALANAIGPVFRAPRHRRTASRSR